MKMIKKMTKTIIRMMNKILMMMIFSSQKIINRFVMKRI